MGQKLLTQKSRFRASHMSGLHTVSAQALGQNLSVEGQEEGHVGS